MKLQARNQLLDPEGVPRLVQLVIVGPISLRLEFFDGLTVDLVREVAEDLADLKFEVLQYVPPDLLHRYLETRSFPVWRYYRSQWTPRTFKRLLTDSGSWAKMKAQQPQWSAR